MEVFNYFDKRLTNAYTESLNSIIRQVDRRGRGHSFEVLRAKVLFNEELHKNRKPRFNKKSFGLASGRYDMIERFTFNRTDNWGWTFPHLLRKWRRALTANIKAGIIVTQSSLS